MGILNLFKNRDEITSRAASPKRIPKRNLSQSEALFDNIPLVSKIMLVYIRKNDGAGYDDIKSHIVSEATSSVAVQKKLLNNSRIKARMIEARDLLKQDNLIEYHVNKQIWFYTPQEQMDLSDKEKSYLAYKGVYQEGWKRIKDPLYVVRWLHENFTPDEFEVFCCKVLEHCGVRNAIVSEKRSSGADGGLDGTGELYIDDDLGWQKVAIQAKRYGLDKYSGDDQCRSFVGTLQQQRIEYGFFMTTGMLSERFIDTAEDFSHRPDINVNIECIDKHKLVEIMVYKGTDPYGFGLHKTDELGFYYMNEHILKEAVS
ncbi:MAG: restriction endonuclease [Pseudomonadota bacterium]